MDSPLPLPEGPISSLILPNRLHNQTSILSSVYSSPALVSTNTTPAHFNRALMSPLSRLLYFHGEKSNL